MELSEQQVKELTSKNFYLNIDNSDVEKSTTQLKSERRIIHWITTPDKDRVTDIVKPKGGILTEFDKTKTVFINHNYDKIYGSNVKLTVTNDGIKAVTYATDKTQMAVDEYNMHLEGVINGWSIGFIPARNKDGFILEDSIEWIEDTNIRIFHQWQLLEYSSTGIPANPNALDIAKSICKSFEYQKEIDYKIDFLNLQKTIGEQKTDIESLKNLIDEIKQGNNNTELTNEIKILKSKIETVGKMNTELKSQLSKVEIEKFFVDIFNEVVYGKFK